MPLMVLEVLNKLTVERLREIANKYNITCLPRKKEDIVGKIAGVSQMLNRDASAIEKVEQELTKQWIADPAPIHNFYKAFFNLDDLTDRK